jgi:hypothetical protein
VRLGLEVAGALEKLFPGNMRWEVDRFLIGNRQTIAGIQAGTDPRTMVQQLEEALVPFVERREKYLLYKLNK